VCRVVPLTSVKYWVMTECFAYQSREVLAASCRDYQRDLDLIRNLSSLWRIDRSLNLESLLMWDIGMQVLMLCRIQVMFGASWEKERKFELDRTALISITVVLGLYVIAYGWMKSD
jgi:hypothetical protein